MKSNFDNVKQLIDKLFQEAKHKCEHLRRTDVRIPYCTKDLKNAKPSIERYSVCDSASLQVWCLSKDNKRNCIWYNGTEHFND